MHLDTENIIRILGAFTAGGLMGIEREFRSKPAGFRTMILICVGSCLFAILSQSFTNNPDRIAANIISGVGFLGAGVVFKEGLHVRGITSAATIWMAAAIGMALGFGFYQIAIIVWVFVMATLLIIIKVEEYIDSVKQVRLYNISYNVNEYDYHQLEAEFDKQGIKYIRNNLSKQNNTIKVIYTITVNKEKHELLNKMMLENPAIVNYDV